MLREKPSIDLIKMEKRLKISKHFEHLITESLKLGLGTGIGITLSNNNPILGSAILSYTAVKTIYKTMILSKNEIYSIQFKIREEIRKTDTYKKSREEYQKYIEKLALFMTKRLGIKDSTQISLIYNKMLDEGFLSYNKAHEYSLKYNQNSQYELFELLGIRIATGSSVCRHNAASLTDLQNEIGNKVYFVSNIAIPSSEMNPDDTPEHMIYQTNHASTLIIDDKNSNLQIYDPTNHQLIENINIMYPNYDAPCLYYQENPDEVIVAPICYISNPQKISKDSDRLPLSREEKNEIINYAINNTATNMRKNEIHAKNTIAEYKKITEYDDEMQDFYLETRPQLERMKDLYEDIVPLVKQKKHVIK